MDLNYFIRECEADISKAKIYNYNIQLRQKTILLNLLLELKEHRKAFGLSYLDGKE